MAVLTYVWCFKYWVADKLEFIAGIVCQLHTYDPKLRRPIMKKDDRITFCSLDNTSYSWEV